MAAGAGVRIFIGGQKLDIDGILLHSAAGVAKWRNKLAQAQPLLGTFSTGIGVWGSPAFVLGGMAAIGLLEAAVTDARQKEGLRLLAEAHGQYERLKPRGVIVPVHEIAGIEEPDISRWKARGWVSSEADVRSMSKSERERIKRENNASEEEMRSGFVVRDFIQDLAYLPGEFVTCKSGERSILVKWSSIETYETI